MSEMRAASRAPARGSLHTVDVPGLRHDHDKGTLVNNTYRHLFGPVPSRRLGRSLGVDLTPFKTCSFDCIFCQLGRTTDKTILQREYVPVDEVIAELDAWLAAGNTADYLTLSGSGEPTLNSEFGRVIRHLHERTTIPLALLTNGTLLGDPHVQMAAAQANVVKVSLSAWDDTSLQHVNRPHRSIKFDTLYDGIRKFRKIFTGELWIEVFLVWGTNSSVSDVLKIADRVQALNPTRVQLNTAVRPSCEEYAYAVPLHRMDDVAKLFNPAAEIMAEYSSNTSASIQATEADLVGILERRPCSLDQLCRVTGLHPNEASKYLGKLTHTGQVQEHHKSGEVYFSGVHSLRTPST
ncbi:MAG TPA: radical SAM protein [Verrucomicrobia bacterium]|nr:radical SAM protein [Verrucomicrobiota bacterium]